jgi:hypothetical protein
MWGGRGGVAALSWPARTSHMRGAPHNARLLAPPGPYRVTILGAARGQAGRRLPGRSTDIE